MSQNNYFPSLPFSYPLSLFYYNNNMDLNALAAASSIPSSMAAQNVNMLPFKRPFDSLLGVPQLPMHATGAANVTSLNHGNVYSGLSPVVGNFGNTLFYLPTPTLTPGASNTLNAPAPSSRPGFAVETTGPVEVPRTLSEAEHAQFNLRAPRTHLQQSAEEDGLRKRQKRTSQVQVVPTTPKRAVKLRSRSKRAGPRCLNSKDVFLSYITHLPDGEVDVSGVFSRGCYIDWLESRKSVPKCPEESFRRTLVAHVAGKDDRQPFPEDVEKKLLERLRKPEAWPMFIDHHNGKQNIGQRGITSQGYHERIAELKRAGKRTDDTTSNTGEVATDVEDVASLGSQRSEENSVYQLVQSQNEGPTFMSGNFVEDNDSVSAQRFMVSLLKCDKEPRCCLSSPEAPESLFKTLSAEKVKELAKAAQEQGIEAFCNNLNIKVELSPNWEPFFYSEEFLIPKGVSFDKTKPIGRFIRCPKTKVILDSDQYINNLVTKDGRSIAGCSSSSFVVSPLHQNLLYYFFNIRSEANKRRKLLKEGAINGEKEEKILGRNILNRDGELKVVISQLVELNGAIMILCQDQTDEFKRYFKENMVFP